MAAGSGTVRVGVFFPPADSLAAVADGSGFATDSVTAFFAPAVRAAGVGPAVRRPAVDATVFAADGAFGFRSAITSLYPSTPSERTYVLTPRSVVGS